MYGFTGKAVEQIAHAPKHPTVAQEKHGNDWQ